MIQSQVRFKKIQQSYYLVFTIIGVAAILVGVVFLLGRVTLALWTVAITLILVFLLHSFVDMLERHHVKRALGIILGYLMIAGIIALLGVMIGPIINEQVIGFIGALPDYVQQISDWADKIWANFGYLLDQATIATWIESFSGQIGQWTSSLAVNAASSLVSAGTTIVSALAIGLMSLVASFWILLDYHRIANEVHILAGPRHQENVSIVVGICGRCFGGYLKGIVTASICTGTIAGVGFYLLGLPYPTFLGFLTAIMNIIPVIGPWIAGIVAAIIGITISPLTALLSILITVIAQEFTDTFISPRIMSTTVELHPALVIFALAVGATIGGVLGMVLAVPVTATAKAVFVYYFEKKTNRRLVSEEGAFFKGAGNSRAAADPVGDAGYSELHTFGHPTDMSRFFIPTDRPMWQSSGYRSQSKRRYDDKGAEKSPKIADNPEDDQAPPSDTDGIISRKAPPDEGGDNTDGNSQ